MHGHVTGGARLSGAWGLRMGATEQKRTTTRALKKEKKSQLTDLQLLVLNRTAEQEQRAWLVIFHEGWSGASLGSAGNLFPQVWFFTALGASQQSPEMQGASFQRGH